LKFGFLVFVVVSWLASSFIILIMEFHEFRKKNADFQFIFWNNYRLDDIYFGGTIMGIKWNL